MEEFSIDNELKMLQFDIKAVFDGSLTQHQANNLNYKSPASKNSVAIS